MARIMSSSQVHNIFSSLGTKNGDTYTVSEDCLALLEEILRNLIFEDCNLRSYRRAVGFGQNIRKDLIPLLVHVKDDMKITDATKIIDTTIKILVNLTIPVEYLLPLEQISNTDVTRHAIFELNQLLTTSKEAFADSKSTKAITDHMKYIMENEPTLNLEQCDGINNCLLLLRNILHIPENRNSSVNIQGAHTSLQNQIIWNLFTQSIDKIIILLLSCPQKIYWGASIVQLIALMYKDQHVGTLQKLLNLWLEASLSDSSEDNESNTSPPNQGSGDSSPMMTSDPTSDSSDNGGNGNSNARNKTTNSSKNSSGHDRSKSLEPSRPTQTRTKTLAQIKRNKSTETDTSTTSSGISLSSNTNSPRSSKDITDEVQTAFLVKPELHQTDQQKDFPRNGTAIVKKQDSSQSEVSDCGYATQMENENQESVSTSSNDDEVPHQKPVHQKPHIFQKTRYKDSKSRAVTSLEKKELRRKKLVKRGKTNIINMKGLVHHQPTDEDITDILKEFTVDFLLKGYGILVQTLYTQLLSNMHGYMDTSHLFWLMTYFLKLATQLELDLEHIAPVLSYDIMTFLIFQGVWLCEELEIYCKDGQVDIKPCLRRLHLVVTAIREYLQTLETYQKCNHITDDDRRNLLQLQLRIGETEDLKNLFLLLLRHYNPNIQSKQYLQDLILTNHNCLLFLDNVAKSKGQPTSAVMEHLKHFATVDMMRQYGILLEDFKLNGVFVNNCIFTMMHHIGGDLEHVATLYQPHILKTFSEIWETDYGLCDDWSDLIEYVIHKFVSSRYPFSTSNGKAENEHGNEQEVKEDDGKDNKQRWTKEEKNNLLGYYNQSRGTQEDTIGFILKKYHKNGISKKTEIAIIKELLEQNIIDENQYDDFMKTKQPETNDEEVENNNCMESNNELCIQECFSDSEVRVLKDYLLKENKGKFVLWLQKVLIEACFVKLLLSNPTAFSDNEQLVVEPSAYYYALLNLPIPIVPWFVEQTNVLKYQPFILLLQKLSFYLSVDTGKIFVRIPNFWNAEQIFRIAQQLGPIDAVIIDHTEYVKWHCQLL